MPEAAKPQRAPKPPVPVLLAALVCDVAVAEPRSGKKNLIGIFDRVHVGGGFPTYFPMYLYVKLADAEGNYELAFRFVESKTGTLLVEAKGQLVANDRLASTDAYMEFPLPGLPIPREGRYEFRIFANDVYLGAAVLDVVVRG